MRSPPGRTGLQRHNSCKLPLEHRVLVPGPLYLRSVRQFIAILTAAAIFLGVTPARELLKLPHLFAHYLEHAQEDGGSFAHYLTTHYEHADPGQGDEHQDKGCLPFQGDHQTAPGVGLGLFDRSTASTDVQVPIAASVRLMPTAEDALLSTSLPGIFQPPRLG